MRVRLRPAYSPEELRAVYPIPHDHRKWRDHDLRVDLTVQVAKFMFSGGTVADLSCGNGIIATSLGAREVVLGDLAPGYGIHGPIEKTLDQIEPVDMFICCETLEHLDNPDDVLKRLRPKTETLILSTPDGEMDDGNPEHYWGWDVDGVQKMLLAANFIRVIQTTVRLTDYHTAFQIWGCR